MLDDQSYYLLGYVLDADKADTRQDKANKLTVKLKRDDLKIRYRSEFFG